MDLQSILFTALGTLVTGLLAWLTSFLTSWINSKIKNNNAAKILNSIVSLTTDAVQATYQSYVEALKGTNMWTTEAQKTALNKALDTIKKQLTLESKEFITKNYGDIETYLKTLIESILYQLKNN